VLKIKLIFLTSMVCFSIYLPSCLPRSPKQVNSQKNSFTSSNKPGTDKQSDESPRFFDDILKPRITKLIKQESLDLGLQSLRDAKINAKTEIRIWVAFGWAVPRCFVLVSSNKGHKAFFIDAKVVNNRGAEDRHGNLIMQRIVLNPPKSGWPELVSFLSDHGVGPVFSLSEWKNQTIALDEEYIIIESRSGRTYNMVYYPLFREFGDRKKAIAVCQKVEQEFDIGIGCGGR